MSAAYLEVRNTSVSTRLSIDDNITISRMQHNHVYHNVKMHALHPAQKASIFQLQGSACVHTLVWPIPHRPVQLGWTCQECKTPTDIALWVTEAGKPSNHFKVHAPGDGVFQLILFVAAELHFIMANKAKAQAGLVTFHTPLST